jgi:hypothetical protein
MQGMAQAEDLALPGGEGFEGRGHEPAERLASPAAGLDESGGPQPAEVPADERLAEPDVLDEIRDRCVAAGEASDEAEAVHVGERPMDDSQLAEILGLVDDRRQGRADSGGRGGQGGSPGGRRRRINDGLYQRKLMLFVSGDAVNSPADARRPSVPEPHQDH